MLTFTNNLSLIFLNEWLSQKHLINCVINIRIFRNIRYKIKRNFEINNKNFKAISLIFPNITSIIYINLFEYRNIENKLIFENFKNLTSLSIPEFWWNSNLNLGCLENLRCLELCNFYESPINFLQIFNLKLLTSLTIYNSHTLSDNNIYQIVENFTNLTKLNISFCKLITNKGFQCLSELKLLTVIDISNYNVDDKTIYFFKNLKSVNISYSNVTNIGIKHLIENSLFLQFLNISYCNKITDESVISIVSNLNELSELDITGLYLQIQTINYLKKNKIC